MLFVFALSSTAWTIPQVSFEPQERSTMNLLQNAWRRSLVAAAAALMLSPAAVQADDEEEFTPAPPIRNFRSVEREGAEEARHRENAEETRHSENERERHRREEERHAESHRRRVDDDRG